MCIDTARRARTLVSALLASATLFSLPSAAQPANQTVREVVISGAAGEPPAIVYGAPDAPLMVSFDAPLKKDGAVTVLGAEVRPHAFVANAFVITPSKFLAAQGSVPMSVPLVDGEVALTIVSSPARKDSIVRIVRRASSGEPAMAKAEQQELASLAASRVLDAKACANTNATAVPRQVRQGKGGKSPYEPVVCGGGAFVYMRVTTPEGCTPATARLTRGEESTDILLVAQTTTSCMGTCWMVVARTPPGDGRGFALELLAEDGALCLSQLVDLKPSSP